MQRAALLNSQRADGFKRDTGNPVILMPVACIVTTTQMSLTNGYANRIGAAAYVKVAVAKVIADANFLSSSLALLTSASLSRKLRLLPLTFVSRWKNSLPLSQVAL